MTVTLHQVAARATVSIATASRALNGLAVAPANLARVRSAAAELGYVANAAARALRSERTLTMGLVFYDLSNLLGVELLDALSETVEGAGYSLLIATARGDAARYDLLVRRFLERRVDALFCIAPRGRSESLERYDAADVPVMALFGRGGDYAAAPLMRPSVSEAAGELARTLQRLGHARVLTLAPETPASPFTAIEAALRALGLSWERGTPLRARDLALAGADAPTAVIASPDQVRALRDAWASGASAPSLISVGDLAIPARRGAARFARLAVDPHRTGRAAGLAMLAWLAGERPADSVAVQAGVFEPGESLGPAA